MEFERRIKVLQGIRQGKIGGGESVLLNLVRNLDRKVFDPEVLSFTAGPMVDELKDMGVPVHVIPTEKPFDFRVWKKVEELLRRREIDLVHVHGTRAGSNMLKAARNLRIPLVYTCHGWSFHPDQSAIQRRMRIMGERYLISHSNVTICVSNANAETGRKLFGKKFGPIVIPNAVDERKFNPHRQDLKNIRKELGIEKDEILILFLARFTWQKQPLILIKSFGEAVKQVPLLKLLMVGDGEKKEDAVKLIDSLKLNNKIILEPFRRDVPDVLAAADIFVLASLWEGLPMALLEAMSMHKAIIASKVDGNAEIIDNGDSGILIDTNDLQNNLTAALVKLGTDHVMRARLGAAAGQRTNEHFSVAQMTRQNEEIYKRLFKTTLR